MARWKIPTKSGNARVKNARKIEAHGVTWDSSLELYMYNLIKDKPYTVERQVKFELIPAFRDYNGKAVRAINWYVDFYIPELNIIIDTKGYATEKFLLKQKLFQYAIHTGKIKAPAMVQFPKTQKECLLVMAELNQAYRSHGDQFSV